MQFRGKSGAIYRLHDEIGNGGEGIVYGIEGDNSLVAKIYKPEKFFNERERATIENKLVAMTEKNLKYKFSGHIKLTWPQDVLYKGEKCVGFVMPRIESRYKIFNMYRDDTIRSSIFPTYTWKYSILTAYNLAWVVYYLHLNDIIIGDLNPNNISLDEKGMVTLLDCDSFDITHKGIRYPCNVGLEEMLPPEAQQTNDLKLFNFTKESDEFSLAIHIFRLLMNNNDPFGAVLIDQYQASSSGVVGNKEILNGECLYVRRVRGKKLPPNVPTLDILPRNIRDLFHKTFEYDESTARKRITTRATAEEWSKALYPIASVKGINNSYLKECPSGHVYSAVNVKCPWCGR